MKGKNKCPKCNNWFAPEDNHACKYDKVDFELDVKYLSKCMQAHEPCVRAWLRHLIKRTGGKIE